MFGGFGDSSRGLGWYDSIPMVQLLTVPKANFLNARKSLPALKTGSAQASAQTAKALSTLNGWKSRKFQTDFFGIVVNHTVQRPLAKHVLQPLSYIFHPILPTRLGGGPWARGGALTAEAIFSFHG